MAFEDPNDALGVDLDYLTGGNANSATDSDVIWANSAGNGHTYKFSLTPGTEREGMNAGLEGPVTLPVDEFILL